MNYPKSFKDFVRFKEIEVYLYQNLYLNKKINPKLKKEYLEICKEYKYKVLEGL